MEALIAALVGWIATEEQILNIQTGLRISDISETDEAPSVEVFFPDGTSEVFNGKDADSILDRAEVLATAGGILLTQLSKFAGGNEPK
jgi:hypothetical protein